MNHLTRERFSWLLILAVAALSAFVLACGGDSANDPEDGAPPSDTAAGQAEELPTEEIPTRWAYGNANDLSTLLRTSDEVFVGRVTTVRGQSQGDQPPNVVKDLAFPITRFEVTVGTVVAGNLSPGAPVVIEQGGGRMETSEGRQAIVVLEGDRLLEEGAEYLFFADRKENGNLAVPPFGRLQVGPNGSLNPLPAWSELGAMRQLTGLTASAAAARLAQVR